MSRAPPEAPSKRRKPVVSSPFSSPFKSPVKTSKSKGMSPNGMTPNRISRKEVNISSPFSLTSPIKASSSGVTSNEINKSSLTIQEYVDNIYQTQRDIDEYYSDEGLCDLVGGIEDVEFFVLMSEQGENSKVYKLNDQLAIKVLKTDKESRNEVRRYKELDPKNAGILNFPAIYRTIECDACNEQKCGSSQSNDSTHSTRCTLIVSELYDGSLFSIKKQFIKSQNRDSIISMLIQVIFSCFILESMGLVHGDLHTGNILYKNIENDQELIYEIDGNNYTVKTYGKLWVLWDFGNMTEVGQIIPATGVKAVNVIQTDIARLVSLLGLRNKGFGELVDLIERDEPLECKDLLLYLLNL